MDSYNQQPSQPPASQGDALQALQPQSKNWVLIIVLVVITALIASAATYFVVSSQKQSQPTPPLPSDSPRGEAGVSAKEGSPTPLPKINETANWKTYSNTTYGFSFKYPPGYTVVAETAKPELQKLFSFVIENPNPRPGGGYPQPYVEAVVYEKDTSSLEEWVTKHTTDLPFDDPSISGKSLFYFGVTDKEETTLGGKKAITFKAGSYSSSPNPTFVLSGDYIIGLNLDSENESKDPDLINIYYPLILSTFKFTPASPQGGDQNGSVEGKFCGGLGGIQCPKGYKCQLDGTYPDAGGKCVKE
ncbi:MAG: hypothetical protein Q7S38_00895 [bacterium]|nr:hypothetical protein [bacterium]